MVLQLGDDFIGDSLAISEWAAEQVPALWPKEALARAHARSAQRYADTLLNDPAFLEWEAGAIAEEWAMPESDSK